VFRLVVIAHSETGVLGRTRLISLTKVVGSAQSRRAERTNRLDSNFGS